MATRSQRRRRQRQARTNVQGHAGHGETMLAGIAKSTTRQLKPKTDLFSDLYDEGKVVAPPYPLDSLLELARVNAVHSGCVNAKVADAVGRGWILEPEDDTEEGTDDDVDQVTRKLTDHLRTICPRLPFKRLIRQWVRECEKTGQGYIEVARDTKDVIAALFPMPPQNVRATKDPDVFVQIIGEKKVFYQRYGSGPKPGFRGRVSAKRGFKDWDTDEKIAPTASVAPDDAANEVIVLQHYSEESPYYGVPEWVSGVPAIAELTAIREFNVSFFESGGQADRLIHVSADEDGGLDAAQKLAEDIEGQIDDARGRAHLSIVTFGKGVNPDVTPLSDGAGQNGSKRDRAFSQGREDLAKELLVAHGVPASRLAWTIVGDLGGSQSEDELDAYRYGVVEPLQEMAEDELNRTLFNPDNFGLDLFPGYTFAFRELDWTSMAEQTTRAETMVDKGMATPNQGRLMMGERESDDPRADLLYYHGVPLGITPHGDAADVGTAETQASQVLVELRDAVQTALRAHEQAAEETTAKSRWLFRRPTR